MQNNSFWAGQLVGWRMGAAHLMGICHGLQRKCYWHMKPISFAKSQEIALY